MLNYNIKGTRLPITDELRSYVERALSHAEKVISDSSAVIVDVELEYQEMRQGEHYRAEFTIQVDGQVYRGAEWRETLHAAIDTAAAEAARGIRRDKRRYVRAVRRGAYKVKEYLRGWRTSI